MQALNPLFAGLGTTIFTVMSALAVEHQAINLGQGFPDEDGPLDVREEAARVLIEGPNQYPPMMGLPALRQAVADHDRRFYGLDYDWSREVLVTSGATEALGAALIALLSPGDEVVLFEPLYDSYLPIIRQAGAVPRLVRLQPPDWSIPLDGLAAAFNARTRLVLFNTPMNPTGKVFSPAELTAIADLARAHDAYVLCDEVYEHLVFSGHAHVPIATLPGMRERTVRIGSAGKTFSLTGWKVGYLSGPAAMIGVIAKVHQFLTFTTPPNLQAGVALGLRKGGDYFAGLAAALEAKRDRLTAGLRAVGYATLPVAGSYFVTADIRGTGPALPDDDYCQWLTRHVGVAAVPVSAFYGGEAAPRHLIRFCFCKRDEILDAAIARLAQGLKTAA
ncbi:aminotransferase [Zavarzinia compransoris]|uniref:Aminotransferase n=1 Tax=Zavarzinia compransoris TaxID=1264899 RepID=A0A317EC80_9PROT|nr:aminotransferase [Zavarzinia compransoris]PWR23876.1 aminotransferase [Zavarzinia compransoris]TDP48117.1 aspartate/methionine/tyrosine aminotransferase [Zavarzinia compransoris]